MTELTQAALRVLQMLGMEKDWDQRKIVERAIEKESEISNCTLAEARDLIICKASKDRERGEIIDLSYFERWPDKRKAAKVVHFPNRDTTERRSASETRAEAGRLGLRVRDCHSCRRGVLYFCKKRDDTFFIKCSNAMCAWKESVPTNSTDIERVRAEYEAAPKCQLSGGAMIEKVGSEGPFLSCGAYPLCNFTMPLPANLRVQ